MVLRLEPFLLLGYLYLIFQTPSTCLAIPPKSDVVLSARWLVSSSDWGVLASLRLGGKVFTNVVSYSDGVNSQRDRENSTGIPYFYLTTLDETARNFERNPTASFTVSSKSDDIDGRCGALDAQEPPCPRITLIGKVLPLRSKSERAFAHAALLSKHPAMQYWPDGHI